ncbi:phosphatase PAP2 family protein [Longispora sp. NPDC051575]|uniref:phosphatase PAP2 family protein n=1 Tax=Longispora sp. NPDC051575 TaxID=3154943 RepID=UPI0034469B47
MDRRSGARVAVSAGLAVLFLAVWVCVRADLGPARLDVPVLDFLAGHRTGPLTALMTVATTLGSIYVLIPLGITGALVLSRRARSWWPAALVALAVGGNALLTFAVKVLDGRARPPFSAVDVTGPDFSFPSGHTSNTTVTLGVLLFLVYRQVRPCRARTVLATGAAVLAFTVGLSRLYLGAHWLTDVLAGYLLAGSWLVLVLTAADRRPATSDQHPVRGLWRTVRSRS